MVNIDSKIKKRKFFRTISLILVLTLSFSLFSKTQDANASAPMPDWNTTQVVFESGSAAASTGLALLGTGILAACGIIFGTVVVAAGAGYLLAKHVSEKNYNQETQSMKITPEVQQEIAQYIETINTEPVPALIYDKKSLMEGNVIMNLPANIDERTFEHDYSMSRNFYCITPSTPIDSYLMFNVKDLQGEVLTEFSVTLPMTPTSFGDRPLTRFTNQVLKCQISIPYVSIEGGMTSYVYKVSIYAEIDGQWKLIQTIGDTDQKWFSYFADSYQEILVEVNNNFDPDSGYSILNQYTVVQEATIPFNLIEKPSALENGSKTALEIVQEALPVDSEVSLKPGAQMPYDPTKTEPVPNIGDLVKLPTTPENPTNPETPTDPDKPIDLSGIIGILTSILNYLKEMLPQIKNAIPSLDIPLSEVPNRINNKLSDILSSLNIVPMKLDISNDLLKKISNAIPNFDIPLSQVPTNINNKIQEIKDIIYDIPTKIQHIINYLPELKTQPNTPLPNDVDFQNDPDEKRYNIWDLFNLIFNIFMALILLLYYGLLAIIALKNIPATNVLLDPNMIKGIEYFKNISAGPLGSTIFSAINGVAMFLVGLAIYKVVRKRFKQF